jgi:methyl-accepting chemotaxis protein
MVQSVNQLTQTGQSTMKQVVEAMNKIYEANQDLQKIVEVIQTIDSRASTINDIVFKTQLLSFNASIEAARAGEQGRGFSVVAEEVGSLAEMSGGAAHSIQELLEQGKGTVDATLLSIRTRVTEGKQVIEQAMNSFVGIADAVNKVNEQLSANSDAFKQQHQGIEQTGRAMSELNEASRKNHENAANSKRVASELEIENARLGEVKKELEVLVKGKAA